MKRVLILVFICAYYSTLIYAQSSTVDSLRSVALSGLEDKNTVNASFTLTNIYSQNNIDSSKFFAEHANNIAHSINDPVLVTEAKLNLGRLYIRIGIYTLALEYMLEAQKAASDLGPDHDNTMAEILRGIGNINFIQYNHEVALEYFREAEIIFERLDDQSGLSLIYGGFANIFLETDQKDSAIVYYKKALDTITNPSPMASAPIYLNLGNVYEQVDSLDQAIYYSELALTIAEENNAKVMATYPLKVLSSVTRKQGEQESDYSKLEESLDYAKRSLELAEELNITYEKKDAHANLSRTYEAMKNFELAYHHYFEEKTLNDSLLNEDANERLAQARAEFEDEKKQQQILLLESEQKLKDARFFAITTSLGFLLALLGLGGARVLSQKQKKLNISEKSRLVSENEKQIAEEQLKNEELRNEFLQKDLTNYALQIVEKNEFLEQVKGEISEIKSEIKSEEAIKDINRLGSRIYQNLMIDQQREDFEHTINELCGTFFNNLEQSHPDLTRQERRLAALLRLDLSSKDIASILNITPKSVDQGRYRLRKKLDLDKDKNLALFLNQL